VPRALGDGCGCVTGEYVIARGDAEVKGGVGEVAAGSRVTGGLFGEAGGVGERAGSGRDIRAGSAHGRLDPPVRGVPADAGVGRPDALDHRRQPRLLLRRRALEIQQHRHPGRQPELILQPGDLHPRRHPAIPLPVDPHKHLALRQIRPVHGPRRMRPGTGLIPHRHQMQPPDRPPRRRPLLRQLTQRGGNKHPHPLIRRQDHLGPGRSRHPARQCARAQLLRLPHVPVLLAAVSGSGTG
jgi:hypothetical protein